MLYTESPSTDPCYNLAMEQYLFDTVGQDNDIFFLWQNDNAIIIGKNQNAEAEINKDFVAKNGIKVVRRLSGGGAVYHDLGNINFTFITCAETTEPNMRRFCEPVAALLRTMGADAYVSGRNDILISGRKVSGNAQYVKNNRCMHHGTILFDSDLDIVVQALTPSSAKLQSKGVASIRSRVATVREHIVNCSIEEFKEKLKHSVLGDIFTEYRLTAEDGVAIEKLRNERYATWEWNFGKSPRFSLRKERRIEGCGNIEVYFEAQNGIIEAMEFFGDYFGNRDTAELAVMLVGCRLEETAVREAIAGADISCYFCNLDTGDFVEFLCR